MIKRIESERIIHFLHRPSIYIINHNRDNIVTFMHGVDFGRLKEPSWTNLLEEFIFSKFNIKGGAKGWPYQIEIFGKKNDLDWNEAFKNLMLQMIEESKQIPYTRKMKLLNQNMIEYNNNLETKYVLNKTQKPIAH